MKVYFDNQTNNIIIEGLTRFFPSGSLVAVADGNNVYINYINNPILEVYDNYANFLKSDGSPAGASASSVVTYLNNEFAKGRITGSGVFSGLATSMTVTDSRVKAGDKIIPAPQTTALNEIVFAEPATDGSVVIRRVIINVLGALTSNLNVNWFRI